LGNTSSSFADSHKIFFGGHDSWTTTKRERDINAVMVNVLKNNAYKNSCKMVFDDFSKPAGDRVLFNNIELSDVAGLLKRFTTTPTPNNTLIDTTTRVDVTGQSVVTLALRGGSEVDSLLSEFRVVNQDGAVVYDGAPLTIGNAGGSVTYNGSLDFGDGIGFRGEYENTILTLPALPQGTTELTITIGARSRYSGTDNAFIQIDVLGNRAEASLISDKIKFQLIDLVQMLWGETYSIESPEITALHDLFNALQTNAQLRGETDTEYGNIRCDGLGDQRKFDLDYTFVAWKGVIAAMLSDASFMLN
jgi:hypothetical protein